MNGRDAAELALGALRKAGSEKGVANVRVGEIKELNIDGGELTLLRTTFNAAVNLIAFTEDRKGATSVNKLDADSIRSAAEQTVSLARSSEPDPANEISEEQQPARFAGGIETADLDLMFDRFQEFLHYVKETYPYTILEQSLLKFVFSQSWFLNSNGVDFETIRGYYDFDALFTTKKEGRSSSFNNSGYSSVDLDAPLWKRGGIDTLIRQNAEQVDTISIPGKFSGDIIVTPDSLMSFLSFLTQSISDIPLITGTSVFKNKLMEKIASEELTIHSAPLAEELAVNHFITGDGYPAGNCTILERGTLTTFLLSLYGARKTGGKRSVSSGGSYIVEPGHGPVEELVKSVKRGALVCRISGGHPGRNGDFSAIAKNSYLIENGEITKPLSETMISGNAAQMLRQIKGISKERINSGRSLLPWVVFTRVTLSGK